MCKNLHENKVPKGAPKKPKMEPKSTKSATKMAFKTGSWKITKKVTFLDALDP